MTETGAKQVKVLLADDSEFMLRAVARLLRTTSQVALIGTAVDFAEAVRLADEHKPDVVVLDLHMAQQAKADVLRLKAGDCKPRLLAITAANVKHEGSLALASAIGADRLLDKMSLEEELIPAILELASN
jgi:two-component system, chemotaxis family, protein-glutamate methylesterase/glutaminase